MAARGAKPKPAHLTLIDGTRNATRHGSEEKLRKTVEQATKAFGALVMPKFLKGESRNAWKAFIEPAAWLDGSRQPAAIAFCELWAEFRFNPTGFPAAKHGQMRAYMSELGLTDERNRGDADDGSFRNEFFDVLTAYGNVILPGAGKDDLTGYTASKASYEQLDAGARVLEQA